MIGTSVTHFGKIDSARTIHNHAVATAIALARAVATLMRLLITSLFTTTKIDFIRTNLHREPRAFLREDSKELEENVCCIGLNRERELCS